MKIKIILGIIVVAIVAFLVVNNLLLSPSEKSLVEKIKERGKIIVGTSADWPPFEYIDSSGGYAGIDIEIAKEIAKKMGVELEIKDMGFDSLIAALKGGQIDIIIADMAITPERELEVDFSMPYFIDYFVFVTLSSSDVKSIEDLYGEKIGVQTGTTQEEWANSVLAGNCTIVSYERVFPEMVLELKKGELKAILIGKFVADVIVSMDNDLKIAIEVPETTEYAAIAVPQGAEDLKFIVNQVIKELLETGKLKQIVEAEVEEFIGVKS